jgi:hypothetical protein
MAAAQELVATTTDGAVADERGVMPARSWWVGIISS